MMIYNHRDICLVHICLRPFLFSHYCLHHVETHWVSNVKKENLSVKPIENKASNSKLSYCFYHCVHRPPSAPLQRADKFFNTVIVTATPLPNENNHFDSFRSYIISLDSLIRALVWHYQENTTAYNVTMIKFNYTGGHQVVTVDSS